MNNQKTIEALKTNMIRYENTMRDTYLQKNNTTGFNGVYRGANNTFRAYIQINYKLIYLGAFKTIEEAIKARKIANSRYLPFLKEKTQAEIKELSKIMRVEIEEEMTKQKNPVVESLNNIFNHCSTREDVELVKDKIIKIVKEMANRKTAEISENKDTFLINFLNFTFD